MINKKSSQEKLRGQLVEWKNRVAQWEVQAKTGDYSSEALLRINSRIRAAKDRIIEAELQLEELEAANDESWHTLRESLEADWVSLKLALAETVTVMDEEKQDSSQ